MFKNPFEISKPEYRLDAICILRDELLVKTVLTTEEQMVLYRLRISELLIILEMYAAELDWAEEDYEKLKRKEQ